MHGETVRNTFSSIMFEVLAGLLIFTRRNEPVAYPGIFSGGGGSTNSVEDRENGDLAVVAP